MRNYNDLLLIPVESSNLAAVGYDQLNKELVVKFAKNGAKYVYFDVPLETYNQLMTAESVGKYFCANVRDSYRFKKIEQIE